MHSPQNITEERLKNLESHLATENPVLLKVVQGFRDLDRVAHRMGLLAQDQSYATRIPWWPLISVLGTFSAGKSSFINTYLGAPLQRTGNQAVDDKFSVICYTNQPESQTLPGTALDSDPRFPFYQVSKEIEQVTAGEGKRIDAYLQLRTWPSEKLRGKIIIDSPGFDADQQRTATLRITNHIVNLSDLVLVFFDARHPEPGAMQDTLQHLVGDTVGRPDSEKFLYILNQMDTAAREDNPEEVVGSWQRGLAEYGLTAGRFFTIYNPEINIPIEDANLRKRFESKRDEDLAEITARMEQVEIQRAYRIVTALEKTARDIEERVVPKLRESLATWKRRVLWADGLILGGLIAIFLAWSINAGHWQGWRWAPPWLDSLTSSPLRLAIVAVALVGLLLGIHFLARRFTAKSIARALVREHDPKGYFPGDLGSAFTRSVASWRSVFNTRPRGWVRSSRRAVQRVILQTDSHIQTLNDRFTNPSGRDAVAPAVTPAADAPEPLPEKAEPASA